MSTEKPSTVRSTTDTLFAFFALYLTTLFSLDTWDAARSSPYRLPSSNIYFRPAAVRPAPGSYQAGMAANGVLPGSRYAGNEGGSGRRDVGRIGGARDSRPAMRLVGTASCGACLG
ncbi:hypothetical protein P154DRAFT_194667 [Amniculicola lignicola CBS 123094]|uniref:Uncharacterized protein n=1 Tax=Amniculicola lignicola CBS 123094 TaxID=1392246 RepID=A0A6A5WFV3_9PLEO|nr:hypothetical protein P154DRAFT_194667 [Amniculicola lignicola CBS 123094]